MLTQHQPIQCLDTLRRYVNAVLCNHNELEPDAFRMTERLLVKAGKPCGIFFCLHGPRAVKFTAIWETEQNTVLFYGPAGERFHKTKLHGAPELRAA